MSLLIEPVVLSLCPSQAEPMHGISNAQPADLCGGHTPTLALPRAHVPCHHPPHGIPQEVCTSPPTATRSSRAPAPASRQLGWMLTAAHAAPALLSSSCRRRVLFCHTLFPLRDSQWYSQRWILPSFMMFSQAGGGWQVALQRGRAGAGPWAPAQGSGLLWPLLGVRRG